MAWYPAIPHIGICRAGIPGIKADRDRRLFDCGISKGVRPIVKSSNLDAAPREDFRPSLACCRQCKNKKAVIVGYKAMRPSAALSQSGQEGFTRALPEGRM